VDGHGLRPGHGFQLIAVPQKAGGRPFRERPPFYPGTAWYPGFCPPLAEMEIITFRGNRPKVRV
jgi:hypothetical protein